MVGKNSLPRGRPDHGDEAAAGDAISRFGDHPGDRLSRVKSGNDDLSGLRRAARLLIDTHGADVRTRAVARSDELLADGDLVGYAIWQQVLRAIDELLGTPADD
jgi:hypothetical protein